MKNIPQFCRRHAAALFLLLAAVAIAVPMAQMFGVLVEKPKTFESLTTALLILTPYLWLAPRWRWTALVPVWLCAVFYLTNLWYFRFFGDFMPLDSYFLWDNLDGRVAASIVDLMRWADVLYVAPAALLTAVWAVWLRRAASRPAPVLPHRVWLCAAIVACHLGLHAAKLWSVRRYLASEGHPAGWTDAVQLRIAYTRNMLWQSYNTLGLPAYLCKEGATTLHAHLRRRTMTTEEHEAVAAWRKDHRALCCLTVPDSVARANRDKNLIFITAESLNAWVITFAHDGHKAMPVLDSLCHATGTVSALTMLSQVQSGGSSDGQLIYNTGLYPATDACTVALYADNHFRALPRLLGRRASFEAIGENAVLWRHDHTTRAYGYDRLHHSLALPDAAATTGSDRAIFDAALAVIDTVYTPFVAHITSLSTHLPYKEAAFKRPAWINRVPAQAEELRNFLTAANYFDTELARFLHALEGRGLLANTIIIIASDHNAPVAGHTATAAGGDRIAFVALGTGMTRRFTQPVGQVDVLPTVLELMGRLRPDYPGMGLSMFTPALTAALDKQGNIIGKPSPALRRVLTGAWSTANAVLRADTVP